ncbi:hypothetical protein EJ02DRAFT_457066 [Clathrospora elynae]|uniref:Uncharacterized protein n=1 Tax=Clathrospora elynae TaxID=706981 RepID=A0A6A5SHZ1_9PLEO|nr:hypothetical protein EJ02DRAFT_457066 [Clathrospora elynae]
MVDTSYRSLETYSFTILSISNCIVCSAVITIRFQLLFVTFADTATAQFTTSVQGSGTATVTFASSSTARPASIPTTSIAVYTPETTIDSWVCAMSKGPSREHEGRSLMY